MRKRDWMKTALVAVGLCLAAFASYAQAQGSAQQTGDPVADAARKAREEKQKKDAQKPKKVYTDDDIKPATPDKPEIQNASAAGATTSGTDASAGATQAADAKKPGDASEKEDPNSEKAWRKRFTEQNKKIADVERELDVLQREFQKSSVQYYADPTKAMNEQNNRKEINDKTAKIEAKKQELAQLRQLLDDMEADLRKAG